MTSFPFLRNAVYLYLARVLDELGDDHGVVGRDTRCAFEECYPKDALSNATLIAAPERTYDGRTRTG